MNYMIMATVVIEVNQDRPNDVAEISPEWRKKSRSIAACEWYRETRYI